jgi:hypothetical protein
MKHALGAVGRIDDRILCFPVQIGVGGIVINTTQILGHLDRGWATADLKPVVEPDFPMTTLGTTTWRRQRW